MKFGQNEMMTEPESLKGIRRKILNYESTEFTIQKRKLIKLKKH